MSDANNRESSPLDRMLYHGGSQKLKASFSRLAQDHPEKAVARINHDWLRFPALYHLLPEIEKSGLFPELSLRNQTAVILCTNIRTKWQPLAEVAARLSVSEEFIGSVLKWMFLTGEGDDGTSDEFDHVMDVAAAVLIRSRRDTSATPEMVRLLFRRNRQDRYIHDLAWALFSSRDTRIFRPIAGYLRSPRRKDVELAEKLLRSGPEAEAPVRGGRQSRYQAYLAWLRENQPYLMFTGEGFHQSSEPVPCSVNLDAKYLCRQVSAPAREPPSPITGEERRRLEAFRHFGEDERARLASYSHRLHGKNKSRWDRWMAAPVDRQIDIACGEPGGAS